MRTQIAIALAASLIAAPAMGQVILQVPNGDASAHAAQAEQYRADAHAAHQQARMDAATGNYDAAAEAQHQAHRDWHAANRQDDAARDSSGAVIIGR